MEVKSTGVSGTYRVIVNYRTARDFSPWIVQAGSGFYRVFVLEAGTELHHGPQI